MDTLHSAKSYRVVLLGDSGIGKTQLMNTMVGDEFSILTAPTIGIDYRVKKVYVEESGLTQEVVLNIYDTAGQEKYNSITQMYYRDADVIIIVYSVDDKNSFANIVKWLELTESCNRAKKYFIGNKCDLKSEIPVDTSINIGLERNIPLFLASAKTNWNVSNILTHIAKDLLINFTPDISSKRILPPIRIASESKKTSSKGVNTSNPNCCFF